MRFSKLLLLFALTFACPSLADLPDGFIYLKNIDNTIMQSMRYHSSQFFFGKKVSGYIKPTVILTKQAALALHKKQSMNLWFDELRNQVMKQLTKG